MQEYRVKRISKEDNISNLKSTLIETLIFLFVLTGSIYVAVMHLMPMIAKYGETLTK